jgi:protease-4
MTGVIGGALKPEPYIELFRKLREAHWARSVLLSIDSPGGSAWASEALRDEAMLLAKEKPVVVYFRGLGASGAYMIATAASRIVALPSALVGSIGVISMQPMARDLLQKVGLEFNVTKGGRLKDMGAFYREPTPEEKERQQALVDELYETFVTMVADARKIPQDKARELATGEIFTGRGALERGLVDELGGLDHAEKVAARLGNVPRDAVTKVSPPRRLRDLLVGSFGRTGSGADFRLFLSQPVLYVAPAYAQGAFVDVLRR